MSIYSAPSLTGLMVVSPTYNVLGQGYTDRVFIVGHADGLDLNDPYQVLDMATTIQVLNLDPTSPVVRTLLEVYYGGGKDIWVIAAAPMSEYQPNISLRDNAYYQTYYDRLVTTYQLLRQWDLAQLVLPVEAPFYNAYGVDFATQLADHCEDAFNNTGAIRIGLLGTRTGSPLLQSDIDAMTSDSRLGTFGSSGKYIAVEVGEGTYSFREMPYVYIGSVVGAVAANMSTLDLRQSTIYNPLQNMVSPLGSLTAAQISQLAEEQLNPVSQTTAGVRGQPYQAVMMTDNTMAQYGSDFWTLSETRLVLAVLSQLTIIGNRYMGTIGYGQFQIDCNTFLAQLVNNNYVQAFTFNTLRDPNNTNGVLVYVSLTPYFGLRQLSFTATIGPGT